ncbi:MBL fold metallo-hydrolase [Cytobacillus gottheilii]|uniref:MBL fold metallo-hydrolase n=1 Tax=Cytobacillus gottheilii TaxID=859144 RepID=A0ABX8F846_9BACI|nr:MBL fold metallo-hydrolase [Cytobacillus gottheilii]QVY59918.1 MBL fold metallo-hydrolase [Cytobacillus gottheilii]
MGVVQVETAFDQFADRDRDYSMLIDAGDFTGDEVIEYLQILSMNMIDIVIYTHPDTDHIGQMAIGIKSKKTSGPIWTVRF